MLYVEQLEHRVFLTSSWCFLYGLLSEMGGHYESCFSRGVDVSWVPTIVAKTIMMMVIQTAATINAPKYALGAAFHMMGAVTNIERRPMTMM